MSKCEGDPPSYALRGARDEDRVRFMGGGRLGRINEQICIIVNSLREDGACDDNTVEYFRCAKSNVCDKTYEPECASIGRSVIWYVVGVIGVVTIVDAKVLVQQSRYIYSCINMSMAVSLRERRKSMPQSVMEASRCRHRMAADTFIN